MSLGQRINGNLEKSVELSRDEKERYENQIRQLKLLSKSQTAFLKAYLSKKLKEAEELVQKAAGHIEETKGDVRKARDLKISLKNLKLHELEVDVASAQLSMQRELELLRNALEQGGQGGNAPPPSSLSSLEAENAKLRDLLAEAKRELSLQSSPLPPAPPAPAPASTPSVNEARYKEEIALLRDQVAQLTQQVQEQEGQLGGLGAQWEELMARKEETSRLKTQIAKLEKDREFALRELENQWKEKVKHVEKERDESRAAQQAREKSFAQEREEMEIALAQELEEMEKQKEEEMVKLTSENTKLKNAFLSLQQANASLSSSLQKLREQAKGVQREYRAQAKETGKDLGDMATMLRGVLGGGIVGKLKHLQEEFSTLNRRYQRELSERKRLHNVVQELKGNIRVYMRCRPPTPKEAEDAVCVFFPNPGEVKIVNEKGREKLWEFDEVFPLSTTQKEVYNEVSALITSVLDGFNVCIFAYGQTGSGKTYTMMGPREDRGVNTRALQELFEKVEQRTVEYVDSIAVSILEVYNEEIRDLLSEKDSDGKLEVKMGEHGNYVPGLTQIEVRDIEAVFQLISVADRNRASATTNMNEHSSRSHMMLTVTVLSEFKQTGAVTRGKLNLVDLAGSERLNKSGAQGQALKEAQNINKSLSALGDVIAARAQKNSHIPFRNSTLTYLLQDSLSQDSKTLMIVCVSPVLYNAEETYCSLNFAARVRTVELGRASKNTIAPAGKSSQQAGPSTLARRTSTGGK